MHTGSVYERIYKKLDKLTGGIDNFASTPGTHIKLKSGGYMDLSIECIYQNTIAIAHYYKQNGDLIADPDMEIRIFPGGAAEALAMQDYFGYKRVYNENGKSYYPRIKKDLNSFLNKWLVNLKKQKFYK